MAIKPQTKKFVDALVDNPKLTQTEAYLQTHRTMERKTANSNASQLLKQPNVLAYLATKSDIAQKTLYQVLQNARKQKDSVNWQRLAKDTANDVLDRVHGKPLTKTTSLNVSVSIEQLLNELD